MRLVVTLVLPMKVLPSPKSEGSFLALEKNWMVKVFLGLLFSVPFIVVVVPSILAEERTGKFCKLRGPVSRSLPWHRSW